METALGIDQLIDKLRSGWELRSRGADWYVCEPELGHLNTVELPVSETAQEWIKNSGEIKFYPHSSTTPARAGLKSVDDYSQGELIAGAIRYAAPHVGSEPRWLTVKKIFNLSNECARELCLRYAKDPDEILVSQEA